MVDLKKEIEKIEQKMLSYLDNFSKLNRTQQIQVVISLDFFKELEGAGLSKLHSQIIKDYADIIKEVSGYTTAGVTAASYEELNYIAQLDGAKILRSGQSFSDELKSKMIKGLIFGYDTDEILKDFRVNGFKHNWEIAAVETAREEFHAVTTSELFKDNPSQKFKLFGPLDDKTRPACQKYLLEQPKGGRTKAEIKKTGYDFIKRGGFNCRHEWRPVLGSAENVDIKQQINDTENFYETLNDKQKSAYEQIKKEFNVVLPKKFYTDDFEQGLVVNTTNKGRSHARDNKITINKNVKESLKATIVHECAHVRHATSDIINVGAYVDESVKSEYLKQREKLYGLIKNKGGDLTFELITHFHNTNMVKETLKNAGDNTEYTEADMKKMVSMTADYIAALTKGKIGYGHGKSYFSRKGFAEAEWFAHCSENYYVGNPYFKAKFTDSYNATIKFMESLSK